MTHPGHHIRDAPANGGRARRGDPMRRATCTVVGVAALLGFAAGCVDRSHTATLVGKVGTSSNQNATESVRYSQPGSLSLGGDQPIPNADIAIVVNEPNGERVLASTKSDANGDFTL